MKKKVGTLIDEEIMRLAKRMASEQGSTLSDMIQEALVAYMSSGAPDIKERERALDLFCERPFKLTPTQFAQVLEEDAWEQ